MLFLLNKRILEVDAPELYLTKHWKRIGCGEPSALPAEEAVAYAVMVVNTHVHDGIELDAETSIDLAALLIAKTGANAALFTGTNEARLNVLAEPVLQALREELDQSSAVGNANLWEHVA